MCTHGCERSLYDGFDEEGIHHSHHNCKGAHKRITQEEADAFLVSDYAYAVVAPLTNEVQLW